MLGWWVCPGHNIPNLKRPPLCSWKTSAASTKEGSWWRTGPHLPETVAFCAHGSGDLGLAAYILLVPLWRRHFSSSHTNIPLQVWTRVNLITGCSSALHVVTQRIVDASQKKKGLGARKTEAYLLCCTGTNFLPSQRLIFLISENRGLVYDSFHI